VLWLEQNLIPFVPVCPHCQAADVSSDGQSGRGPTRCGLLSLLQVLVRVFEHSSKVLLGDRIIDYWCAEGEFDFHVHGPGDHAVEVFFVISPSSSALLIDASWATANSVSDSCCAISNLISHHGSFETWSLTFFSLPIYRSSVRAQWSK
jgi:hypothetical protein